MCDAGCMAQIVCPLVSAEDRARLEAIVADRNRTFKRSSDPDFAAKLEAIVGLYLEPPAHSLVLSLDEKSQIQALDRTQPGLPLKPGKAGTMTHDYKRHGTTTLFAALNVLDGRVLGRCMARHRGGDRGDRCNAVASSCWRKHAF